MAAFAEIKVGVSVSATGPAASLGIPEKNTIALLPTTIGGQKVKLHRPRRRLRHHQRGQEHPSKLISEDKVDVVIGSTTSPNSLAMIDVAADNEDADDFHGRFSRIVEPMDDKRRWVFKTAQNDAHMVDRDRPAHDRQQRPDRRLHRLCRRLRRRLVRAVQARIAEARGHEDRRQRAFSPAPTPRSPARCSR
jgi:hypothetical protein